MLVEALNSAYPNLNIKPDARIYQDGDAKEYTVFTWDE